MSLLREIQDLAASSSKDVELSSLLRKCKILAARLNHTDFKAWIEKELNGYDDTNSLPSYRILETMSKGHFSGWGGSGLRNAPIPTYCLEEKHQKYVDNVYITEGISALEDLLSKSDGTLHKPWRPQLLALYGTKFYENMNCIEAWQVISSSSLANIVDTVRTKILNFVLEIEAENPDAGDAKINSNPIEQGKITQIFNTTIHGNVQNVATGSSDFTQNAQLNSENEKIFEQLLEIIKSHSNEIDGQKYKYILDTINEMKDTKGTQSFSGKYVQFIELINSHAGIYSAIAPFIPALTKFLGGA